MYIPDDTMNSSNYIYMKSRQLHLYELHLYEVTTISFPFYGTFTYKTIRESQRKETTHLRRITANNVLEYHITFDPNASSHCISTPHRYSSELTQEHKHAILQHK